MQTDAPKTGDTLATIKTTAGEIVAKIFVDLVPEAAKNFVELAKEGKYEKTIFHRVIEGFMIQGGDFTRHNGTGGHSYKGANTTIGDEYHADLVHVRGALSWAKTARPNSIGSQFFIVHGKDGARFLDHKQGGGPADGYSVFGQMVAGWDVLDAIATARVGAQDRPAEPVSIESIAISVAP